MLRSLELLIITCDDWKDFEPAAAILKASAASLINLTLDVANLIWKKAEVTVDEDDEIILPDIRTISLVPVETPANISTNI